MKKDKHRKDEEAETISQAAEDTLGADKEDAGSASGEALGDFVAQLAEKDRLCEEYLDKFRRSVAEFENYKKRAQKEKEATYRDAYCDVVKQFLPVCDNLKRADAAMNQPDASVETLKSGVEMIMKGMLTAFEKLGVSEIPSVGQPFDPELHNAVMHVEDPEHPENTVVEEFQTGYRLEEKVIRHSMVKVAN